MTDIPTTQQYPVTPRELRAARRRVVITGLGTVGPHGTGASKLWEGLSTGRSGIDFIQAFEVDESFPVAIAGEVRDFDPLAHMERKDSKRMDRFSQFAIAASLEALTQAGLASDMDPALRARTGVAMATGVGGVIVWDQQAEVFRVKGPRRVSPFFIPSLIPNMAAGQVSMRFGLHGPSMCHASACAASAHAIGEAARWIQNGVCDAAVAGGSDTPITPLVLSGFAALKALCRNREAPTKASRPFDADRNGFVCAEGAGVLVLEEREHALARGAQIFAELIGYASTSDAYHVTAPAPEGAGAAACMSAALYDADLQPEQVDYINAHGTSTDQNDVAETQAIKRVFGEHAATRTISSTKSMTGHLLGAGGGIEAVISSLAIHHGLVPPTINLDNPGPGCDLDYTPHEARSKALRSAISNSFGFGGHNVTLVFAHPDAGGPGLRDQA